MDYTLKSATAGGKQESLGSAWQALKPLLGDERRHIAVAVTCVIVSTAANLLGPVITARIIDTAIKHGDYGLLLRDAGLLAAIYLVGLVAMYLQTLRMGTVGRNVLFKLRGRLFAQLSRLPIAFFAQNRAGDLISRVNSDTDKINQFFSQALMQMFGSLFRVMGAGIILLCLNWRMGLVALAPALVMLVLTRVLSPWVKHANRKSLESLGALSGDVSESLANFQVIVAFNRVDYFREKFKAANQDNYRASVTSGVASGVFAPLYTLAGSAGSILVLGLGVWLILHGQLSVGLLVGYLLYVSSFYDPLRQLATVWSSLQTMMAAMDRVSEVLKLEPNLVELPQDAGQTAKQPGALLAFENVRFAYPGGKPVIDKVDLTLERGKTYALVGPTGGGKTTTAMLMARLYDPTEGTVYLEGRDIRTFTAAERAAKIGFILQDPFLLAGKVRDNIVYGHPDLGDIGTEALTERMNALGLAGFLARFGESGLDTPVKGTGDGLSLGQKQLVAFLRAVMREPDILILDEATANIDTVTEQMLEEVLARLPETTTRVIIAHRLNTIQNADEIFFVGGGTVTAAGSMAAAMDMLLGHERTS
ncbi:ABC transporter ATP-binding protein [Asticcacaulis solisilvae]|uniref:ABC transporter ATP-binding protein n=1 Tax=Asticcacaulis solisilvae TaxID=1217274 RepID=UPI003FD7C34B